MESVSHLLLNFLVNSLWQVTAVFLAALLLARLLRSAPARYLHGLWVLTLAVCILLPTYSALPSPGPEAVFAPPLPALTIRQPVANSHGQARNELARSPASASAAPQPSFFARLRDAMRRPLPCPPAAARALTIAYALFLLYALARFGYAWRRKNRMLRGARSLPLPAEAERVADSTKRVFGLESVTLLWSASVPSPLTAGFRRPVIVLPDCLLNEPSKQVLTAVLAHEMAHIRRRDFFFNLVFELLLLPFSFHPAALAVRSRIARTREQACDEVVAGRSVEAPVYARALLDLARLFSPARTPRYSVGACDTDVLEERVMRIMKLRDVTGSRRTRLFVFCAGLAMLALGAAASAVPLRIEQPVAQTEIPFLTASGAASAPIEIPATLPPAITEPATTPAQPQSGNPAARDELKLAIQSADAGQRDVAIAHLKRAIELDPNFVEAHLYLATAYAYQQVLESATAEFQRVLNIDPRNVAATFGIGNMYFRQKNFDQARVWFQKALDLDPQNAEAYYSLGVIDWTQTYQPRMQLKKDRGIAPNDPIEPASLRDELCSKNLPLIHDGIRVLTKATELRPEYKDAIAYLNLMFREQADCEATADARARDLAEADRLVKQAMEIMKKQQPVIPPDMPAQQAMEILKQQGMFKPPSLASPPPSPPPPSLPVAPPGEKVIKVGGLVQAAKCVQCPAPPYPAAANGATGIVEMAILINKEGVVQDLIVSQSTAPVFTEAAIQAVRNWRYKPTIMNQTEPVFVHTSVKLTFDPSR